MNIRFYLVFFGNTYLRDGPCSNRKYAVALLHHKDIIEALSALFSHTPCFQDYSGFGLTVHIIREIAVTGEQAVGEIEHFICRGAVFGIDLAYFRAEI